MVVSDQQRAIRKHQRFGGSALGGFVLGPTAGQGVVGNRLRSSGKSVAATLIESKSKARPKRIFITRLADMVVGLNSRTEANVTLHKNIDSIDALALTAGKGVSMKMLLSPDEAPNFAMRNFVIAAGGSMPLHTNSIEHEQFVLAGRARVQLGERTIEAVAGDVLLIPAGVPHSYETLGDEAYSFLCLIPKGEDHIEILPA